MWPELGPGSSARESRGSLARIEPRPSTITLDVTDFDTAIENGRCESNNLKASLSKHSRN